VSGTDIDEWQRSLKRSPRTRNNLRSAVKTLLSFAKARRLLPKNHDEIESVTVVKDGDGEIEIFTPTELAEILSCAGEKLIPSFALGAFAGVRHAEIQRLDWKDVRFDDGIIEIRAKKAKTASRRIVPIVDCLRAWLLLHRQPGGPVCAYRNMAYEIDELVRRINQARRATWAEANGVSDGDLERGDARARKRAAEARPKGKRRNPRGGLPLGAETAEDEGWAAFAWKHNALRHSFISYRVADIQNVAQVALEVGNSPQMIFKHYRELVRPADAKTWFSIVPGGEGKVTAMQKAA
jgi:integrase